ncbi:alternate-type signal peptide domain-containing protein [Nocardioides kongjuensis]|uniref:Alternate signal-mediated exported protein n=1 Tax=Nocardioides kongjuensis TaxID=349522 RepID=A0A852RG95_9ACTN|nr:alternate-type signal peptide domain-containing protein [Nocardioides kongjuensis]NYD29519.1 alternate signal-mediated exported protein [Nocardioides kongjuensis]
MKKTTKGALAAGTAAVLLMGGAGTLAYWTDSDTVTGSSITSGHLSLDASACQGTTGWLLEGAPFDPSTGTLIPGDTLSKTCNAVVNVKGTHFTQVDIQATAPNGPAAAAPWDELTVAATVNGSTTGANNVAVSQGANNIPVSITVTWPYGPSADNDLNGDLTTALGNIAITAVQDHKADPN